MPKTRYTISPIQTVQVEPNVYLGKASGYYDPIAKKYEMITLLPGSYLSKNSFDDGWVPENIAYLIREGAIEDKGTVYEVIKPICGTPGGTAAITQGKDGSSRPNGYKLWKFSDGKTIDEAGERPNK
ncbi:hypothetical protein [Priestia koreensis]|uniref:hypothetical protein n=1 Tax=Priestia koreensis TaxID=284581 RepID=UPI00345B3DE4